MRDLMTTREVAEYLRIKQRKVYDLVQARRIPCTRVTGKWLFPRSLVDRWVAQHTVATGQAALSPTPPVLAGSHDPLLEWATRESGSELAMLFDGSLDGVRRVLALQACVCGMHVIDTADGSYNRHLLEHDPDRAGTILVQWAWREQGLMTAPGNPLDLHSLQDVCARKARFIARQDAAGSHVLLEFLLAQAGIGADTLQRLTEPARTERDAALAVASGAADAALGIGAAARAQHLDFLPLQRERYDLLLHRRDYFEPAMQALLQFTRTPAFISKARDMGGYDIGGLGRVVYNAP